MTDTTERARADTADLMAEIVASSGDAIIGQTVDGIVTCWNAAAERLFGWPAEEMLGHPIARIVPVELRETERELLARIRAGSRVEHIETERLRRGGPRVPVFATFSPMHRAGEGLVGISTIMRDLGADAAEAREDPVLGHTHPWEVTDEAATVLLVEDDMSLLDLLRDTLADAGLTVITATDGRMALGLLEMHPEVAVVVSDIVMPNGVSGVLLAREAQRMRPDLPVLLMSGHPPEEIGRLGNTAGYPFLVKPFRPDDLTRGVRHLLH